MMTINGAKALGLDKFIGSLEPGKLADITAISLNAPNTLPINNPLSHVVYSVNSSQVSHVWVGGRNILHERQLQTVDLNKIQTVSSRWQKRIQRGIISQT